VYRVDIEGYWAQDDGVVTVHYADDGTTPYVAFPGLAVTPEPLDPAPEPTNWFEAPERTLDAFNGEGELIDTTGTQQVTATTAPLEASASASSDDSDGLPTWIWGVVAAVVLAGGGVWLRRRRTEAPAEHAEHAEHAEVAE
jgi:MYXO-CTERM domain-containing protein